MPRTRRPHRAPSVRSAFSARGTALPCYTVRMPRTRHDDAARRAAEGTVLAMPDTRDTRTARTRTSRATLVARTAR